MTAFPVFDLAAFAGARAEEKRQMGREVDRICRASGFLAVRNHGVPDDVIAGAWMQARAFFDLPPETKDHARAPYPAIPMAISDRAPSRCPTSRRVSMAGRCRCRPI